MNYYLLYTTCILLATNLVFMHILMKHNNRLTELTAKSKEQDNTINTLVKFVNSTADKQANTNTQAEAKIEKRLQQLERRQEVAVRDLQLRLKGFQDNLMNNY